MPYKTSYCSQTVSNGHVPQSGHVPEPGHVPDATPVQPWVLHQVMNGIVHM
jgi:hypothetical protein